MTAGRDLGAALTSVTIDLRTAVALVLSLASSACGNEAATPWVSPIAFDTMSVTIHTEGTAPVRLLAEVARTAEQRALGLGLRPMLDPESGMIFLYDSIQPGDAGFWMWRTRIPLDIAFMDGAGAVLRVFEMQPCTAVYVRGCPTYEPGVPYWSALEVNSGWFEARGVAEGSLVELGGGGG